jgi:hypothetical protein
VSSFAVAASATDRLRCVTQHNVTRIRLTSSMTCWCRASGAHVRAFDSFPLQPRHGAVRHECRMQPEDWSGLLFFRTPLFIKQFGWRAKLQLPSGGDVNQTLLPKSKNTDPLAKEYWSGLLPAGAEPSPIIASLTCNGPSAHSHHFSLLKQPVSSTRVARPSSRIFGPDWMWPQAECLHVARTDRAQPMS